MAIEDFGLENLPPEDSTAGRAARFGIGVFCAFVQLWVLWFFVNGVLDFAQAQRHIEFRWSVILSLAVVAGLLCALVGDRAVRFVSPWSLRASARTPRRPRS